MYWYLFLQIPKRLLADLRVPIIPLSIFFLVIIFITAFPSASYFEDGFEITSIFEICETGIAANLS